MVKFCDECIDSSDWIEEITGYRPVDDLITINELNEIAQDPNKNGGILEEVNPVVLVGSKEAIDSLKVETKPVQKQKRVELFENEDVVLEQRGNRYYLSLYDKKGNFQREVTIDVKDDYKVGFGNCK